VKQLSREELLVQSVREKRTSLNVSKFAFIICVVFGLFDLFVANYGFALMWSVIGLFNYLSIVANNEKIRELETNIAGIIADDPGPDVDRHLGIVKTEQEKTLDTLYGRDNDDS
jgi:hypothetical protein